MKMKALVVLVGIAVYCTENNAADFDLKKDKYGVEGNNSRLTASTIKLYATVVGVLGTEAVAFGGISFLEHYIKYHMRADPYGLQQFALPTRIVMGGMLGYYGYTKRKKLKETGMDLAKGLKRMAFRDWLWVGSVMAVNSSAMFIGVKLGFYCAQSYGLIPQP